MTKTDAAFLRWVIDRLVFVYGESSNVSHIVRLREIADRMADEAETKDHQLTDWTKTTDQLPTEGQWVQGWFVDKPPWGCPIWTVRFEMWGSHRRWFGDHYCSDTANEHEQPEFWRPIEKGPISRGS